MYTVPIKLWVDKLLSKCARTDMTNTFLMPQTMSNSVTLQNNSLDLHEVPSQEHTGATHEIAFTDSHSRPLGKLQAIRTNTDATGVQLEVNGNTLGLQVSDEGIPISFVNHPYPDGPANQIATMKYVADWGKYLEDYLYEVKTLLDQTIEDIQTISSSMDLLENLRHIDDVPTEGSNNLVRSGGIYSWVLSKINQAKAEMQEAISNAISQAMQSISIRPVLGQWHLVQSGGGTYTSSLANGGFVSVFIPYEETAYIWVDGKKPANAAWGYDSDDDSVGGHDWLAPRQLILPVNPGQTFSVHCRAEGIRIFTAEWL